MTNPTDEEIIAVELNLASQQQQEANPAETESNDNPSKPKLDATFFEEHDDEIQKYLKEKRDKKYPKPFMHHKLMFNKEPDFWHSKAVPVDDEEYECGCSLGTSPETRKKCGITKNFRQRLQRSLFVISTPIIFLIVVTVLNDNGHDLSLSAIIGGALCAMFTLYMGQVLFYVLSARNKNDRELYRVYSVSDKPDRWANINTAYLQLIYDKESIQSISELSAINGGITKTMLNTLGAYTWAAVSIHFAGQLADNGCVFHWDIADIFEITGTAGIVLISIFELDPFSKAMGTAHYAGVMLAALCPAGYCIQQWYLHDDGKFIFSVMLYVVAFIALVCFMMTGWATDEAQLDSKQLWKPDFQKPKLHWLVPRCFKKGRNGEFYDVNTFSKMNVVFEATAIYLTTVALCLWLIEYDKNCKYGCAGIKEVCN